MNSKLKQIYRESAILTLVGQKNNTAKTLFSLHKQPISTGDDSYVLSNWYQLPGRKRFGKIPLVRSEQSACAFESDCADY